LTRRLRATMLLSLMTIGAFSIWTVVPLGWIWIGSHIANTQQPQLSAYFIVLCGIVISVFAIGKGLAMLNRRYLKLMGGDDEVKIPLPWMRSMRDEERHLRATALDVVLVSSAGLAVLAMVIWFFVLAGSPLPGQ
jgi:hypothetical protein